MTVGSWKTSLSYWVSVTFQRPAVKLREGIYSKNAGSGVPWYKFYLMDAFLLSSCSQRVQSEVVWTLWLRATLGFVDVSYGPARFSPGEKWPFLAFFWGAAVENPKRSKVLCVCTTWTNDPTYSQEKDGKPHFFSGLYLFVCLMNFPTRGISFLEKDR